MADDPIIPPPLAPELTDLLTATERDVLRAICRDGDILDGIKARLLSAAHGMPDDLDDGEVEAWLLVPLSPALLDALAAFEADEADLEEEPDDEEGGDAEPSLGATNDKNQEKAWRGPTDDLEFDGDGVADADCEPTIGAPEHHPTPYGSGRDRVGDQTFWARGFGPDECEIENEHGEGGGYGDGSVDMEPMLGATEDIDQRKAWARQAGGAIEDGEAQGTEDDLVRAERTFDESQTEEAAKRAAVQEAVGRLRELTGARAYGGAYGRVRFYRKDEIRLIDGVGIVGVLR